MTTLKTITTIELSSICNLACKYCINRLLVKNPVRTPGIMSDEVFDKTLEVLSILVSRGTQKEINLNGNGESTLDPQLIKRAKRVKEIIGPDRMMIFSTNGKTMTEDLALQLKECGFYSIDISCHDPYSARMAVDIFRRLDVKGVMTNGPVQQGHNWAGQLEPENQVKIWYKIKCDPLIEGRGYVQSEGLITPCCYDYRNLGVFGSIFDKDLLSIEYGPYELCKTCHQELPEEL